MGNLLKGKRKWGKNGSILHVIVKIDVCKLVKKRMSNINNNLKFSYLHCFFYENSLLYEINCFWKGELRLNSFNNVLVFNEPKIDFYNVWRTINIFVRIRRIYTIERLRGSEATSSDGIDMQKRAEVSPSHNVFIS